MDILQLSLSSSHEVFTVSVAHNMYVATAEYNFLKLNRKIAYLNSVLLRVLLQIRLHGLERLANLHFIKMEPFRNKVCMHLPVLHLQQHFHVTARGEHL